LKLERDNADYQKRTVERERDNLKRQLDSEINRYAQEIAALSKGYLSFDNLKWQTLDVLKRVKRVFDKDATGYYYQFFVNRQTQDSQKATGFTVGAWNREKQKFEE